ncbi:MAG: indolepyruvate ferredoxin oxidoreductase family protein [Chloroflexota bacterium]|nr:indolepyruvate ferredoxin oxidoreductase family protein [Chloroflexota bacterium]
MIVEADEDALFAPVQTAPEWEAPMQIIDDLTLRTRYERETGRVLLTGIQALVRLPVEQHKADERCGLRTATFISGYEGSPLAGYDLSLQREGTLLSEHAITIHPGLNEEVAATSVWGTQQLVRPREDLDGVVGIWYGKAPGLDRAHDAIRHANLVGASKHGGVLVLAGDDPACKSSTLASASEGSMADLGMPVLYPGDVQEVLDFGLHGIALSRYCGSWVGMKIVADVADAFGTVDVGPQRVEPILPPVVIDGKPWQHSQIPQTVPPIVVTAEPHVFRNRVVAARLYAVANGLNRLVVNPSEARIGLVAAGKTYYEMRQALVDFGLDDAELERREVRVLKLGMISPLDPGFIREFATGLDEILVIEEKRAFIERQIRDILYNLPERPLIFGKEDEAGTPLVPIDGELTPDRLAPALAARLSRYLGDDQFEGRLQALRRATGREVLTLGTTRAPFFCSGCPHNRSTVIPDGSLVGAGIGCHTLVQLSNDPRRNGVGLTQMGGEGAQWIGQAPFSEAGHMFQNLGDGTFFHSGSLAIRAAIASGVNITYKLLYNGHVAMTGGQQAVGAKPVPVVVQLLKAEGVGKIIVLTDETDKYPKGTIWPAGVDLWPRERLDEAQLILRDTPGVTVLIYDQQCATEARRMRKRGLLPDRAERVVINELVCEGCGDCGRVSNCLSVQPVDTEFGRKTRIHQSSCNHDFSCLDGDCPSFVTIVPNPKDERPPAKVPVPPSDLPTPVLPEIGDGYSLYLMGIGGTGVVTVNQLLATAATLDGHWVTGLDQLGLSQKAGPVVSHLRLLTSQTDVANRVTTGKADLYLALDALIATETRHLAVTSPDRTIAVVSTGAVPTGEMIRDHDLHFPGLNAIRGRIDVATRADRNVYVDALGIAEGLLRNHMTANVVAIGAAYQAGALPITADSIERAIELNGTAVSLNIAAFRWGRAAVANPGAVEAALSQRVVRQSPTIVPTDTGLPVDPRVEALLLKVRLAPEVERLVRIRANELLAFQDFKLARRYVAFVGRIAAREDQVVAGQHRLSEAVTRYLYKLMAYKDEYEVARLHVDPRFEQALADQFPEGGKVSYRLHPPMLRSLGMDEKLELGEWFRPAFQALYAMRRLRGTPLDPFGYAEVRRIERELVVEYAARMRETVEQLRPDTYDRAVELAELPDIIRGYEEIKLANVALYREALAAFEREPAMPDVAAGD